MPTAISLGARLLIAIGLFSLIATAFAQDGAEPGTDLFEDGLVAPQFEFDEPVPPIDGSVAPQAPGVVSSPESTATGEQYNLILEARLVEQGAPIAEGIIWRIFGAVPAADGSLPLLASLAGGTAKVRVTPGDYLVHAAFGRVGMTRRVTISGSDRTESLVLNAGGMRLGAVVGDDEPIASDRLSFEILQEDENGELATVIPAAAPGRVVRLAAGTYHVISRFGAVNAVVRADIQVEPGRLTEAVMRHTGAQVTLKLVSEEGGEALANTVWTVLTQDGNTIHESIGAFPSIILAAGNYTAVATHQDQIYSRDFEVASGVDRDIEVRLTDLVQPDSDGSPLPEISGQPMEP